MNLLGFLMHQKPSYPDKVWMTKDAALKGMMTEALQALMQSGTPVILSYFSDRQQEISDFTLLKGVPYSIVDANFTTPASTSVLLMDAQWLHDSLQAMDFLLQQSKIATLNLLFYGHYPIPEKENELLNKIAAALKLRNEIKFFSSLDDRAFEMFGADNIKGIMEKMGLKENEAIEHAMVTKAMARARQKIAAGVRQEVMASTESAWYQKNYKI